MKTRLKYLTCIICKHRKKQKGSLFCKKCSHKGVFIKIAALKESKEYKGRWMTIGMPQHPGRLPRR